MSRQANRGIDPRKVVRYPRWNRFVLCGVLALHFATEVIIPGNAVWFKGGVLAGLRGGLHCNCSVAIA